MYDVSNSLDADILIYNGSIDNAGFKKIFSITENPTRNNVLLILSTFGGDPNAAFKIARRLQQKYSKFHLYVHGYCKSAGTLIAIGAHELIMSDFAELGPLDVQLPEEDELGKYSSGLNVDEGLLSLQNKTFSFFQSVLNNLIKEGLSTKVAAELSTNLAIPFVSPILSQIDPLRLGATQRAVEIALAYGERLLKKSKNLKSLKELISLVQGYPDHGFVIDYEEALVLFKNVRKNTLSEASLVKMLNIDELSRITLVEKLNLSTKEDKNDVLLSTIENRIGTEIDELSA